MAFALLFAAICLDLRNTPANLLSLGALDFGMVVDGSVVMVENIVRHLSHARKQGLTPGQQIREAAHEVQRPVFYARVIIIAAYLPVIVGGLIGALVISVFLLPTLYVWVARPEDVLPIPETEFEN
jgi:Cu/Ag efflux pump CusA